MDAGWVNSIMQILTEFGSFRSSHQCKPRACDWISPKTQKNWKACVPRRRRQLESYSKCTPSNDSGFLLFYIYIYIISVIGSKWSRSQLCSPSFLIHGKGNSRSSAIAAQFSINLSNCELWIQKLQMLCDRWGEKNISFVRRGKDVRINEMEHSRCGKREEYSEECTGDRNQHFHLWLCFQTLEFLCRKLI